MAGLRATRKGGPLHVWDIVKTSVYVDGFNLYYELTEDERHGKYYRWLDLTKASAEPPLAHFQADDLSEVLVILSTEPCTRRTCTRLSLPHGATACPCEPLR